MLFHEAVVLYIVAKYMGVSLASRLFKYSIRILEQMALHVLWKPSAD